MMLRKGDIGADRGGSALSVDCDDPRFRAIDLAPGGSAWGPHGRWFLHSLVSLLFAGSGYY